MNRLEATSGGHTKVPDDWMPATGLRALIQQDPALLWLKFHGNAHNFQQDPEEYSFLNWIGQKGRDFEDAWVKNIAPDAVQALAEDKDVGRVDGLKRTLDLMARRVPVITKAALWNAEERIYGSADVICLSSWFSKTFPHLKPENDEPDAYCVIDCKFSTGLDASGKKIDLAMNTAQVRLYSFMLGQMQGHMPRYAYLATRDRIHDPLPVAVNHKLDGRSTPPSRRCVTCTRTSICTVTGTCHGGTRSSHRVSPTRRTNPSTSQKRNSFPACPVPRWRSCRKWASYRRKV